MEARPNSHLDANLEVLARRQPELARLLGLVIPGQIEVFVSAGGLPSARFLKPSGPALLHSRYDPMNEAQAFAARHKPAEEDCCVLLGFGLGYLLDALCQPQRGCYGGCFVVESSLEILRAAFEARDLRAMLSLPRLHFAWPPSGAGLRDQWNRFFDPVHAEGATFITHPPSVALAPEVFKSAAEIIQSGTFQILTDINTLVGRSEEFLANFARNVRHAMASPGVASFAGKFSRVPAVIVSAGPSLDRNIHELRPHADSALILATDTSLKPLITAGVEPHFILTADPAYRNFMHLKGAVTGDSILVAEATSHPGGFSQFAGRTISCTFENSSLKALSQMLADKGSLRAWGSVATMALDFALRLGCDPIIFVGQDLAYTDGRTYCGNVYTEEEWFHLVSGPEEWMQRWENLRKGHKIVLADDIFGQPVETTEKLRSYWNWIVKEIALHPEIRFINATEGGILREGVEIRSLREALWRHCSCGLGLNARTRQAYAGALRDSPVLPGQAADWVDTEMKRLREVLREGITLAQSETSAGSARALEETKEAIYARAPHLGPLLDTFNQMGNITFLRKRARIARSTPNASELGSVYREYFDSVRAALDRIAPTLSEIRQALTIDD